LELSEKESELRLDGQLAQENMRRRHIADYFWPFPAFDEQQ
jgi:hypothetical protein